MHFVLPDGKQADISMQHPKRTRVFQHLVPVAFAECAYTYCFYTVHEPNCTVNETADMALPC